jgi:macrolide-specific efflux system membrane fusion protein
MPAVDANGAPIVGAPVEGTVQIMGDDGKMEIRNVTVGLTDDTYYEVIKGLEEGESVVVSRAGSESRYRNPNPLRGIPGAGGGRGR